MKELLFSIFLVFYLVSCGDATIIVANKTSGDPHGTSCSTCTGDAEADVFCEDFDIDEYLCTWSEVTTDCASGYPNGNATHSGIFTCTDISPYALEIKYAAAPSTELCYAKRDAGSAQSAGHIQFYLNVIDHALSSGSVALAQATASANGSNDILVWKIVHKSSTTYDLYFYGYNTSAGYTSIYPTAMDMDEGTWYRVSLTYDTDAGTAEMFIDGVSMGTINNLNNTRDPRYFFFGSVIDVEPGSNFQVDLFRWDDDTMPSACPFAPPGTEYYISPTGDDSASGITNCGNALKTFTKAATILNPGDTLYLCDGVYTTSNSGMMNISAANGWPNGTTDNYITITGANTNCGGGYEACAIIDGQSSVTPCSINGRSYYKIEDISCEDSSYQGFSITSNASYNEIRRVSVYNAANNNGSLFSVQYGANNNLIEDCIASQKSNRSPSGQGGRYCYLLFNGSHDNIFRRNYCNYQYANTDNPCASLVFYGSYNNIVENLMSDMTNATCSSNPNISCIYGQAIYNDNNNNHIYGSVCFATSSKPSWLFTFPDTIGWVNNDYEYHHNVSINLQGAWQDDADNYLFYNNTMVNHSQETGAAFWKRSNGADTGFCTGTCNAAVRDSSFLNVNTAIKDSVGSAITHTYNNIYGATACYSGTTAGTGETCNTLNPAYDTATFGNGAYLIVPTALQGQGYSGGDVGAEVIYQFENGTPTANHLWPFPMEDRIMDETGYSVTYEANGGIWKTLTGVYP